MDTYLQIAESINKEIDLILSAHYPPSARRDQVRDMLHERVEHHLTMDASQPPVEADAESQDEFDFRHSIVCNCFVCRKRHRTA